MNTTRLAWIVLYVIAALLALGALGALYGWYRLRSIPAPEANPGIIEYAPVSTPEEKAALLQRFNTEYAASSTLEDSEKQKTLNSLSEQKASEPDSADTYSSKSEEDAAKIRLLQSLNASGQ